MKNINIDLEEKVNAIRDEFCPDSNFDLFGLLLGHNEQINRNNALTKVFLDVGNALASLKKMRDLKIYYLKQSENLPSLVKEKLHIAKENVYEQKRIDELTEYLYWLSAGARKGEKYQHSDAKPHIHRLAFIFYEMTGEIPICISNRESEYGDDDRYTGNFYDFLIKIKDAANDIGIKLPDKKETVGKYAYQILNGYPEDGYKLQLFSENEALKHRIIYVELNTTAFFKYVVIAPNEVIQFGEIYFKDIVSSKNKKFDTPPITIPMLNRSMEAILRITSSRGHTLFHPPFKLFLDRFTASADAVFNY